MGKPALADLDALAAVARHRSFRRAALERGVSPALLSQTVRRLEEQLGLVLLRRTTRSVAPTAAGEQLLQQLNPALAQIRDAVDRVHQHRGTPMGLLRINAPAPIAQFLLAPLAAGFLRAHPQVEMEITADAAKVDIVQGGFDAGVRFVGDLDQDMVAVPIGPPQRYAVVAAPAYLANVPPPAVPGELADHACIRRRFQGGSLFTWSFRRRGQAVRVDPPGPLTVNDAQIAVNAAVAGMGIAYVHEQYALRELQEGRLVRLLDDWSPGLGRPYLYYPRQRYVPSALRAFIDFARAQGVPAGPQ